MPLNTMPNIVRKHSLLILCSIWSCLFSNSIFAIERWQHDAYIENSFIKIALEREYKETANPKIVRWEQPVKIFFSSDAGDTAFQKELLSVHVQHLSHITGLPIDFTLDPEEANLFAIFTYYNQMEDTVRQYIGDPNRIRKALNEAVCLGNFSVNKQREITKGVIIIPVDYARQKARFLDCIVEEITQLLGLPNDSNDVYPSIFNDVSTDAYLTPLDYLLLRTLYSPRLKTGLNVTQTKAILPSIMKDLHQTQEIENSIDLVQEYSLRRYLGE
ncbi:DUF2927 domain-containing protein [Marinomonas mediterranea]|uniref:DUF2927 domain-containing protein n=1 Tax=Marinomonas mediterranea TaxID=119864 RepID=UPI00234AB49E|nr:DUF2927 domain-containing protein [Marinomonas mediterranea]WCN10538.1 DUF2927 domain-containing protein [Marinomonas mediterranea]